MVTKVYKNRLIKFTNMQAVRVGIGIRVLRQQFDYSPKELAIQVGVTDEYISLLEEGHEPEVAREILEKVAQTLGVYRRGTTYTNSDIINIFLHYSSKSYCSNKDDKPRLL